MHFEDAARESGVIPPERVASLVSCLNKAPDYSWMLTGPHPNEPRLQGDILAEIPVAIVAPSGEPKCKPLTVLALNNTCDLQRDRSEFITVAPVMDFEDFTNFIVQKRGERRASNYLKDVRENHVFEILWLPPFGSFSSGALVFLDRIGSVAAALYDSAVAGKRRVASFSQNGFYFLLIKVTKHLARPESEQVVRQN